MTSSIINQFAGVWIDHVHAYIIALTEENGKPEFKIKEKLTSPENRSGGGEHTINNSSKGDLAKYLKNVSDHLISYEEIYIFGPGTAQEQLLHFIQNDHRFNHKKASIAVADRITDNQMIANVREFYKHRLV